MNDIGAPGRLYMLLRREGNVVSRKLAQRRPEQGVCWSGRSTPSFRLTDLGMSLGEAFCGVWIWAEENLQRIENARQAFDARPSAG